MTDNHVALCEHIIRSDDRVLEKWPKVLVTLVLARESASTVRVTNQTQGNPVWVEDASVTFRETFASPTFLFDHA
jgi:hypothetical protein